MQFILFSVLGSLTLVVGYLCEQLGVNVARSIVNSQFPNHRSVTL
jgi:hypothetical protein